MGERKKEQTFVSRHRTGLALLKIVHKVDSAVIPLRIIQTVLDVAGSYLGLYLTARFIDSLLEGRFREDDTGRTYGRAGGDYCCGRSLCGQGLWGVFQEV